MSKIKNIIFDLGGVIINLNFGAIEKAFQKLLGDDYQTTFQELQTKNIFNKFEVGQLSEEEFLTFFTRTGKATPKEAAEAWHSILSDVPAYRLEVLKSLGQRYNIYLLSNTNYTHVQRIERDLLKIHGVKDFRGDFFVKGYYSYEIGMRKPEQRIYQYVLEDAGLIAEETIFIDDNQSNIESAASLGIQTILHEANSDLRLAFKDFL